MHASTRLAWAFALLGAALFVAHYHAAAEGWFLREDSRYFANAWFSPYDLVAAFLAPHNEQGYYRPVTKLYWALPQWLGLGAPFAYHLLSLALLALSALALGRLAFLLFADPAAAALAAAWFALLPVNAKPAYWLSAAQDLTCSLAVLAALAFRIELHRRASRTGRATRCRALSLIFLFLAFASREVGFAAAPLLLYVDCRAGRWRRGWDVAALFAAMATLAFVVAHPFTRIGVQLTSPLSGAFYSRLWDYALAVPFAPGDSLGGPYGAPVTLLAALLLAALAAAPFFDGVFLLPALLGAAGVLPFALIQGTNTEYAFLFGAGVALTIAGLLARTPFRFRAGAKAAGAVLLCGYFFLLAPSRAIYREIYVSRSHILEGFFTELSAFARAQPPYRPLLIESFGPYRDSPARDTHHFIANGLDQLLPDRTVLYAPASLSNAESNKLHDPSSRVWAEHLLPVAPPLRVTYGKDGFHRD